jgi:hypothetical protein
MGNFLHEFKSMFNQLLNQNNMIINMLTIMMSKLTQTASSVRIAVWNANGLVRHVQKIILFLNINQIDILLISESHATDLTVLKIPNSNHPDGTAHAGSAIIIKSKLKH